MRLSRRNFLAKTGALAAVPLCGRVSGAAAEPVNLGTIPATGERIPSIGMGTWITFNVGENRRDRDQRVRVLQAFFDHGGGMIDSSPMYGAAEEVIGYCLERTTRQQHLLSATKVWTHGQWLGVQQMQRSQGLWGVERFDLMQIHNMLDWRDHLETLKEWKQDGRIRYLGITTSHGRRHGDFEKAMLSEDFDFVQFTYNAVDREAERRLLPVARERGQAVIVNRPFQRGALFDRVRNRALPGWARDIECENWAQAFLKYIISHPAVTCAIPATSRVDHMLENMGALHGPLPDASLRKRMAADIAA